MRVSRSKILEEIDRCKLILSRISRTSVQLFYQLMIQDKRNEYVGEWNIQLRNVFEIRIIMDVCDYQRYQNLVMMW